MDRVKLMVLIGGLLIFPLMLFGQDRYAVHYRYKPQVSHSLNAVENLLSEKALIRRVREGVQVDSTDLPVSPKYVSLISSMVEEVVYHSKWLNTSIVVAKSEQMEKVAALPFVQDIKLVGQGGHSSAIEGKKSFSIPPISLQLKSGKSYAYDFQNDLLGITAMHQEGFTGAGIVIAVFDAGFLNTDEISGMKHLFEQDQILATRDFVNPGLAQVFRSDGHGTAALSLMATHEEGQLVAGAYDARYILCITEDVGSEYRIEEYNWVRAAEFSDSLGVDIINSSLGYNLFDDAVMNYKAEDLDGKTAIITRGAAIAAKKGILVVSSAGNEGNVRWQTITAPADAEGILAVGSVNGKLERSSFSSIGPTADGRIKPDLVAFGSGVTVWKQVQNPNSSSGTSFTSPQIAALAAGLWQARPEWTRQEMIDRLLASGTHAQEPTAELGYGIPNFMDAYHGYGLERDPAEFQRSYIYPNPLKGNELFIHYGNEKQCSIRMISTLGQIVADLSLSRNSEYSPYRMRLNSPPSGLYLIECVELRDRKQFRLVIK